MERKRLFIFIGSVFLTVVLAVIPFMSACAKPAPPEVKTLRIGHIIAMTGPIAAGLESCTQGVQMAADWVNEQGGITVGGDKYQIELVLGDNQSTPDGTVAIANKLVYDEGIKFIVGPIVPWLSIAMQPVTEEAKVLRCLLDGTGTPAECNPETPYTFGCFFEVSMVPPVYDYLTEAYPQVKKVAIIGPDEPGGQFLAQMSAKEAQERGLEVVFTEAYPIGTEDYYPLWTKILATEPDAVEMGAGNPPMYAGIIKAGRELGFNGLIYSVSAIFLDVTKMILGPGFPHGDVFGLSLAVADTEISPMINEIRARAMENYGMFLETQVGGWAPLWFMVQAIEAAQSLDATEVVQTWEQMDTMETPFGTATMGGQDFLGLNHVVMMPYPLGRLENGEVKTIKLITPRFPKMP